MNNSIESTCEYDQPCIGKVQMDPHNILNSGRPSFYSAKRFFFFYFNVVHNAIFSFSLTLMQIMSL